ncbi:hypothetical protein DDT52_00700 [Brenneria roseae subsp. roseae]|uniref:hypothetical protein n=1 Tax=Brenneria roseae TaxID=1509241 RepID=UPI000D61259B|nr:hypothetical protein [Brenneria roseae]PWC22822.1 hypothetical protein DDT52_00700 [Brenneria roseae subsp. roseae]
MKKKKSTRNPLEDTAILTRLARKASRKAIKEAFQSGVAIHYIAEGKIVREYPDGKKEIIH